MPILSQRATVLRRRANAILRVRADQFDPTPPQTLPQLWLPLNDPLYIRIDPV
jgi:hypothetical protein